METATSVKIGYNKIICKVFDRRISKLLLRLEAGHLDISENESDHQQNDQNSTAVSHFVGSEGLEICPGREHLAGVRGAAFGHNIHIGEDFQAVDRCQQQYHRHGRLEQWQCDVPDILAQAGAIDKSRLMQLLRDSHQPGNEEKHIQSKAMPGIDN